MSVLKISIITLLFAFPLAISAHAHCTLKQLAGTWHCGNGPPKCTPGKEDGHIAVQNDGSYHYIDGAGHEGIATIKESTFTATFNDNGTSYSASVDETCELMRFEGGQIATKVN